MKSGLKIKKEYSNKKLNNENNILLKRLKRTYRIIKHEAKSMILSGYGYLLCRMIERKKCLKNLEIGSGGAKRESFITLDLSLKADIPYDLLMGLPFKNNKFELIYAEHVLEHFEYDNLTYLIKECSRCLKIGGIMKIVVPNTKIWINAFTNHDDVDINKHCGYNFGLDYLSNIDYLNYVFYMGDLHKYMFDEKNIIEIFLRNGFKEAHIRDFEINLDLLERKGTSLYVMAIK